LNHPLRDGHPDDSGMGEQPGELVVYQDGGRFYARGGGLLYTAPVRVPDGDMEAAYAASRSFERHMAAVGRAWRWEAEADRCVPAAHNGIEGDLLSEGVRPVPMGDVSPGHTQAAEKKALDALTRDAQRSGTVPLADKKPSVLPTLTPITTQVRKLELSPALRREMARADAAVDQAEMYLADNFNDFADLMFEANRNAIENPTIKGAALMCRALSVAARRIIEIRRERGEAS